MPAAAFPCSRRRIFRPGGHGAHHRPRHGALRSAAAFRPHLPRLRLQPRAGRRQAPRRCTSPGARGDAVRRARLAERSSRVQVEQGPCSETYLAACRYFATERWEFSERIAAATSPERFELLIPLSRHGRIEWGSESAALRSGEVWLLPAALGAYQLDAASRRPSCCAPTCPILQEFARELADQRRQTKPRALASGASDERRQRTARSRRHSCRRTRHALLAAQPHAHAEAIAEYRRAEKPCSSRPSSALRRSFPPRASGSSPTTSKPPRCAASCRRLPLAARSCRARRPQHRGGHRLLPRVHLLREASSGDALMAVLPADHFIAQAGALSPNRARGLASRRASPMLWSCWASRRPARKPATATSNAPRATRGSRAAADAVYRRAPLHRKAVARAGPQICRLRPLFLERGHVLLARLHVSRKSRAPSSEDARRPAAPGRNHRHAALRCRPAPHYPQLENISVDYAILEPASRDPKRSPVFVLPAAVGWSDIGSWAAVYELLAKRCRAKTSPPAASSRSTPRAISSGVPQNSSPPWAFAIWSSWKRPTLC